MAILDPALREVLARLAATHELWSAWSAVEDSTILIGMVGLPGLSYGGSTGLELELAGQRLVPAGASASRVRLDPLTPPSRPLDRLSRHLDRTKTVLWFYRALSATGVGPGRSAAAETTALLAPHAADLHVLDGPLAIEVLPAIEHDKGTALRTIVAQGGPEPALVLYAGDAANDAPALAMAHAMGGIALGIGPEPPAEAVERLPDPAALTALLAALAETLAIVASRNRPIHHGPHHYPAAGHRCLAGDSSTPSPAAAECWSCPRC